MKILGGTSRASVLTLRKALAESASKLSVADSAQFANDLFTILEVISSSVGLRRALTDNSRDSAAKSELISNLFGKNLGAAATSLFIQAVSLRWSSPSEIADAIENLAVEAESYVADKNNDLELVESQLFDFAQLLIENSQLRQILNSSAESDAGKQSLLESVVKGKYASSTLNLLTQVVKLRRGRNIDATLATYSHYVSTSRNRLVAHVKSAVALTESQKSSLIAALSKQLGKQVHVNIEIDPKVLGGISIRYADEVIDGTISNRLVEASRSLVG
jgi:F-type H+-transporting ATPase subunit delta